MTAVSKGATDVEATFGDAEGSASVDGVLSGVDPHLDLHLALDRLGRRLDEQTVPTTTLHRPSSECRSSNALFQRSQKEFDLAFGGVQE